MKPTVYDWERIVFVLFMIGGGALGVWLGVGAVLGVAVGGGGYVVLRWGKER